MSLYLNVHVELIDHPKTKRLRRLLDIPAVYAQAHLVEFWKWVMAYAPSGDISKYDALDIAEGARWEGDAEKFLTALIDCGVAGGAGFVQRTASGKLIVHDWHHYGGKILVNRFQDSFRKKHNRQPTLDEIRAAGLFPPEIWHSGEDPDDGADDTPTNPGTNKSASAGQAAAVPAGQAGIPEAQATVPGDFQSVPVESISFPADSAGFRRSLAERREAKLSLEQLSSEELSVEKRSSSLGVPVEPPEGEEAAAAADMATPIVPEVPPLPSPSEGPAAFVRRILAEKPSIWAEELESRWKRARDAKKAHAEWPWKQRVLTDWLTGAEPPPDAPRPRVPVPAPQPDKAKRPICPDWLPGVPEAEARELLNRAFDMVGRREDLMVTQARRLWRNAHPDAPRAEWEAETPALSRFAGKNAKPDSAEPESEAERLARHRQQMEQLRAEFANTPSTPMEVVTVPDEPAEVAALLAGQFAPGTEPIK